MNDWKKRKKKGVNEEKEIGDDDDPGGVRVCLEAELAGNLTGAKVLTTLKRVVDGGLDVPHAEKGFLGYDNNAKSLKDVHRAHIYGKHMDDHMSTCLKRMRRTNTTKMTRKKKTKRRKWGIMTTIQEKSELA